MRFISRLSQAKWTEYTTWFKNGSEVNAQVCFTLCEVSSFDKWHITYVTKEKILCAIRRRKTLKIWIRLCQIANKYIFHFNFYSDHFIILTRNCDEKMARLLLDKKPEWLDISNRETRKWLKKVYNDLYPFTNWIL